ncbi:hypothetical protein EMIT0158MI4_60041 [Burkholderia ambifaria]
MANKDGTMWSNRILSELKGSISTDIRGMP